MGNEKYRKNQTNSKGRNKYRNESNKLNNIVKVHKRHVSDRYSRRVTKKSMKYLKQRVVVTKITKNEK